MPTTTGLATSFITFSRPGASGGGATTTDRDGKIKWAGHNLLSNSESFDASAWTKNSTVTANNAAAPNGTTTAELVDEGTASGYKQVQQNITTSAGVNYTLAIFAKYVSCRWLNLSLFDNNSASQYAAASFDLQNGVVGNSAAVGTGYAIVGSPTMTPLSGGWYLCSVTVTNGTSVANRFAFSPSDVGTIGSSGLNTYTGASKTFYAWGAHLYRSDLGGMQLNPAMPAGMQSYYPTTPRNLLGFTEDINSWTKDGTTVSTNAVIAPNGLQTADAVLETATTGEHSVYQSITASSGQQTLSFYAKAGLRSRCHIRLNLSSAWRNANFILSESGSVGTTTGFVRATITALADGWYRCEASFSNRTNALVVIGVSTADEVISYAGDSSAPAIYLWGAQLSDSASLDTYVPVYGAAVTSAAYYAPRLDFDGATLAAKGLLVEELRTNLLLNSNNFSLVGSPNNLIVTTDTTASPDGLTNGDTLTRGANNAAEANTRATTSQAISTAYALSVYVKAGSAGAKLYLRNLAVDNGTTNGVVQFDPSNGSVSLTYGSTYTGKATMTPVGGGWYRCVITGTTTSTIATNLVDIGVTSGAGAVTGTSGDFVYVYGAQLEAGSFPTSLIPTGSATATRAADVASVSTQAFPYSASEGSYVIAFNPVASDNNLTSFSLTDGSASNRIISSSGPSEHLVVNAGGVLQANIDAGTVTAGAINKLGVAFATNDFAVTIGGGTVGTDTSGSVPIVNRMSIGNYNNASGYLNGWVRQVTYLPRRISNAELQSRTA